MAAPRLDPIRPACAALLACVALLGAGRAGAEPQASVGLTLGAAGVGYQRAWSETDFHLGLHGDVLFGRNRNTDFGIGPYAEVMTQGFKEVHLGAGLSVLLPVLEDFPLVVSAGPFLRAGDDAFGIEPGASGQLFWGSRSYNFNASYVMGAGLLAQVRRSFGASGETAIVLGAQVDVTMIALPFVALVNLARSNGSGDTGPVR